MNRIHLSAAVAGLLASGLPAAARAEGAPAPSPSPPAAEAPKAEGQTAPRAPQAPAAAQDERDRKIQELEKKLDDALRRIEELEKAKGTPTPAPPETPPTPPPPAQSGGAGGGATLLPNISAIGNITFGAGDTRRVPNRGRFNFDEFEIALQDAVAPKLRYDVFLSAAKDSGWKLGMEEGYLTATALAKGLNARAGRIRTPFGKFNPLHPHVWPFITQPSAAGALLGPEGVVGDGAVLEYTLPTRGYFLRTDLGAWQTTSDTEKGLGFAGGGPGAYSGRLWFGTEMGRDRELELGVSRYQGRADVAGFGRRMESLTGVDLTYRAYPGSNKRLMMSAELIDHQTELPGDDKNRLGAFAYVTYRPNQFYEGGARLDYTRFPYPIDSYDWGGSLFLTRFITEQTSLRLEYQYTRSPLLGTGSGIYFQILFGSGPHVHALQ